MTLSEQWFCPAGFKLVRRGISAKSRRDGRRPQTWRGLSGADCSLLSRWWRDSAKPGWSLYTDVVCGIVADEDTLGEPDRYTRMWASVSALRIDACVYDDEGWRIIEVKPDAGYTALGQLLTYKYWGAVCDDRLKGARLAVVTDACQEAIRPVFAEANVEVIEVGEW